MVVDEITELYSEAKEEVFELKGEEYDKIPVAVFVDVPSFVGISAL